MIAILFTMVVALIYIMLIFKANDEKKDMMCVEKCNGKDCNYCIDTEQCTNIIKIGVATYGAKKTFIKRE